MKCSKESFVSTLQIKINAHKLLFQKIKMPLHHREALMSFFSRREHSSSFQNAFPLLLLKYFPDACGLRCEREDKKRATWANAEELIAGAREQKIPRSARERFGRCSLQMPTYSQVECLRRSNAAPVSTNVR